MYTFLETGGGHTMQGHGESPALVRRQRGKKGEHGPLPFSGFYGNEWERHGRCTE